MSPDGRHVAFIANSKAGSSLWVRSLACGRSTGRLRGTDGARNPFWSPDSRSIGFFVGSQLKTVKASGDAAVVPLTLVRVHARQGCGSLGLAPLPGPGTARTSSSSGRLSDGNLRQTDVKRGGMSTPVTPRDDARHVPSSAALVPFRRSAFPVRRRSWDEERAAGGIADDAGHGGSLERSNHRVSYAEDTCSSRRGGNVMAQSFNEQTLRLEGDPMSPSSASQELTCRGIRGFSVSTNGRTCVPAGAENGTAVDLGGPQRGACGSRWRLRNLPAGSLDLSPDGQQLAVSRHVRGSEAEHDIWLIELATGRATPLTDDHAGDYDPAWSPDGTLHRLQLSATGWPESVSARLGWQWGRRASC